MRSMIQLGPITAVAIVMLATDSAHAEVAGFSAAALNVSAEFEGMPGYEGLQTWRIAVLFTNPADVIVNTTQWQGQVFGGALYNADPIEDDPLGVIDDATGGHTPIPAGIIGLKGYEMWAWDSSISLDHDPAQSLLAPGTVVGAFEIVGGTFDPNPGSPVTAGPDQSIVVAQLTFCEGAIPTGTFIVGSPSGAAGAQFTELCFICSALEFEIADVNTDFCVDGMDLGILLSNWSIPVGSPACGGDLCCPEDINHDGVVDGLDLGILLANWTGALPDCRP